MQGASKMYMDTKRSVHTSFVQFCENNNRSNTNRMDFFGRHKNTFRFEEYLHLSTFSQGKKNV